MAGPEFPSTPRPRRNLEQAGRHIQPEADLAAKFATSGADRPAGGWRFSPQRLQRGEFPATTRFVKCVFACLLLSLLPAIGVAGDDWRTFTSPDGRTLVAKIVTIEPRRVTLELKGNGRKVALSYHELSKEDVEFIRNQNNQAAADDAKITPAARGLYPRSREEIRDELRKIERSARSESVSKEVDQATRRLNMYRFLCGVPATVKPDAEFSKGAADAALACKNNGGLSHSLGHSTDKCNLSSDGNMIASVSQYMEDSGENNREARGHRAWCLNPSMGKVGFGSAGGSFSAMWCMDSSGQGVTGTWAYPGKGFFPAEYFHGNAWSLYGAGNLGAADKIKVEMTRLAKRPTEPFADDVEVPGHTVKINHVSTTMNGINFEPAEPNKHGIYWIRVSGNGVISSYLVELY